MLDHYASLQRLLNLTVTGWLQCLPYDFIKLILFEIEEVNINSQYVSTMLGAKMHSYDGYPGAIMITPGIGSGRRMIWYNNGTRRSCRT